MKNEMNHDINLHQLTEYRHKLGLVAKQAYISITIDIQIDFQHPGQVHEDTRPSGEKLTNNQHLIQQVK